MSIMNKEAVGIIYSANNIKYQNCELYREYIISLLYLILQTYMGDDITNNEQKKEHFNWCWNKNVDNFKKEGINIDSPELYQYVLDFISDAYYSSKTKTNVDVKDTTIVKIWSFMLDYGSNKVEADVNSLVKLYTIFEKSTKSITQ